MYMIKGALQWSVQGFWQMRVLDSPLERLTYNIIKKCPQKYRQTTTPGSLPYSFRQVRGFF